MIVQLMGVITCVVVAGLFGIQMWYAESWKTVLGDLTAILILLVVIFVQLDMIFRPEPPEEEEEEPTVQHKTLVIEPEEENDQEVLF